MADERDKGRATGESSPLDDDSVPFYTISQVAQILGLQPAALRRLDEQRIVSPSRSEGNQRRYSRHEVERLREVIKLTDDGVTLPGVREVLALRQRVSDLEGELDELRAQGRRDDAAPEAGDGSGDGSTDDQSRSSAPSGHRKPRRPRD
jgi:MerR family transcriptional regulator/heat shock protein HspR